MPVRTGVVAILAWLSFSHLLKGEETEPQLYEFSMVGSSNKVYRLQLKNRIGTGVDIHIDEAVKPVTSITTLARSLENPLFTYHSAELGQIAIVPCFVGGGTGVSVSTYFALACRDSRVHLLRNDLAEYWVETRSGGVKRVLHLDSEFKPIENGFSQIVNFTENRADPGADEPARKRLELRFRVVWDGLQVRSEAALDKASAITLLEIMMQSEAEQIEAWGGGLLLTLSPEIRIKIDELLRTVGPERVAKFGIVRSLIEAHFSKQG